MSFSIIKNSKSDSEGVKPGQSCGLQASDRCTCSIGQPSSPKFPFKQVFEQDLVPPPQVTEQAPKSEHSSTTKNKYHLTVRIQYKFEIQRLPS